jgi:hypothetical protein
MTVPKIHAMKTHGMCRGKTPRVLNLENTKMSGFTLPPLYSRRKSCRFWGGAGSPCRILPPLEASYFPDLIFRPSENTIIRYEVWSSYGCDCGKYCLLRCATMQFTDVTGERTACVWGLKNKMLPCSAWLCWWKLKICVCFEIGINVMPSFVCIGELNTPTLGTFLSGFLVMQKSAYKSELC